MINRVLYEVLRNDACLEFVQIPQLREKVEKDIVYGEVLFIANEP